MTGNEMKTRIDLAKWLTIGTFILLSLNALWFTTETAGNLLKGDDWRFLLVFYKKWLDGTFQFKDWFSDHHPIAWHALVYIANAEFFSLQRIYGSWLGLLIKFGTGALLLWKMLGSTKPVTSTTLSILFPIYGILLYFGMNESAEYTWALLTYESSMTFLCGLGVFILLDKFLAGDFDKPKQFAAVILATILALLLMGTLVKLLFVAGIFALGAVSIAERKMTRKVAWPILVIVLALAAYTLFMASLHLPQASNYSITMANVAGLITNGYSNLLVLSFGLAAGISSTTVLHYPSVTLDIFVMAAVILVGYSIIVFYRERMWEVTIIPAVLVIYMLLTFFGAIVFRANEIVPGTWPLYIPRYFPTYHMGWIGVIWIYCYKFRKLSHRGGIIAIASLLTIGICLMLLGITSAWRSKPYIEAANNAAVTAFCRYAAGDQSAEKDIPIWIRGHSFSHEGVQLLQDHQLNLFSNKNASGQCSGDLRAPVSK